MLLEAQKRITFETDLISRPGRQALVLFFPLIDLLCAVTAFHLAYVIRIQGGRLLSDPVRLLQLHAWWIEENYRTHFSVVVVMAMFMLAMLFHHKQYSNCPGVRYSHELVGTLQSLLWTLGFGFVISFVFEQFVISRFVLVGYVALLFPMLFGWRLAARKAAEWGYVRGGKRISVLIVGTGPVARQLRSLMDEHPWLGLKAVGFLREPLASHDQDALGSLEDFDRVVKQRQVQEVVFACSLERERMVTMTQAAQNLGIVVKVVPDLLGLLSRETSYESLGGITVARLFCPALTPGQRAVKRVMDVAAALVLTVTFAPVALLAAFLIRLGSRGPVIFRQTRLGERGRPFVLYKFRSMFVENDDSIHREFAKRMIRGDENVVGTGKVYKITNDARLTRIGRFLRKFHLDELPQLWNVFKGDLSMAGPRPPLSFEYELYERFFRKRLLIKPGITGLWQVSGKYKLTFEQMVMLDLRYINEWSIWLDLKILLATVPQMLRGTGA